MQTSSATEMAVVLRYNMLGTGVIVFIGKVMRAAQMIRSTALILVAFIYLQLNLLELACALSMFLSCFLPLAGSICDAF